VQLQGISGYIAGVGQAMCVHRELGNREARIRRTGWRAHTGVKAGSVTADEHMEVSVVAEILLSFLFPWAASTGPS